MAKTTKYTALRPIVNLNGKSYEVDSEVTGLMKEQEERLLELNAIGTSDSADSDSKEDSSKEK